MKPLLLARFTPSLTAPEDLEAIFVQREPLAERILAQLQDSLTTANKHHTLLVGPRGIGKTHLLTLVRNRLIGRPDLRTHCIVAWLREDEWGVMSFLDLLLRILRSLKEGQEAQVPADRLDALHDLPAAQAETAAATLLREVIGTKTLVLLMENLDDIFRGLVRREQGAFRAFLQEHACVTILATTPGLFEGVSRRKSPFFGFFRIHHLDELTFEDAVRLLHKIAVRRGQDDLAAFILTPTGRARIRAIHHLAQGNPRVYVILSEFLTRQSLDDLVDPVLRMLDDLTPYYQSRLSWLSNQQRKLVEFLASHRIPCTVKELARRCFISPQTASAQLRKLVEWGYVRFESEGRESYYELREPLMRFCLDLKKERKEPLRPLVEILRIWWTPDELEVQLRLLDTDMSPTAKYLVKALEICRKESNDPRANACRRDFHKHLETGELEKALTIAEDWVAVSRDAESLLQLGYSNMMLERWDAAWSVLAMASQANPKGFFVALFSAFVAQQRGDYEQSVKLADQASSLDSESNVVLDMKLNVLAVKAGSLAALNDYEGCIACCDQILGSGPTRQTSDIVKLKVRNLMSLERFQQVETTLTNATQGSLDADGQFLLAVALYRLNRESEALANLDGSIALDESVPARLTKAKILAEQGRSGEVMSEVDRSLAISPDEVRSWTPTLIRIVLCGIQKTAHGLRDDLAIMNRSLERHGVPTIRATDLMTVAAKIVGSDESTPDREEFANFFEHLSVIREDENALLLWETLLEFGRTRDISVLLRLPFEERQLLDGLTTRLKAKNVPKLEDASRKDS